MLVTLYYVLVLTLTIKEATTLHVLRRSCCRTPYYDSNEHVQTLKEIMLFNDALRPETLIGELDPIDSLKKNLGFQIPTPIYLNDNVLKDIDSQKAYECSLLQCLPSDYLSPVCACNYNTGNVVTFKNSCDIKKHNCRFDTAFHGILDEVCPWEFESRRNNMNSEFNYDDSKYYN